MAFLQLPLLVRAKASIHTTTTVDDLPPPLLVRPASDR